MNLGICFNALAEEISDQGHSGKGIIQVIRNSIDAIDMKYRSIDVQLGRFLLSMSLVPRPLSLHQEESPCFLNQVNQIDLNNRKYYVFIKIYEFTLPM